MQSKSIIDGHIIFFLNSISCKFVMVKKPSKLFEKKTLNYLVNRPVKSEALCFFRLTKINL